jgi:hypothetical protein
MGRTKPGPKDEYFHEQKVPELNSMSITIPEAVQKLLEIVDHLHQAYGHRHSRRVLGSFTDRLFSAYSAER